MKLWSRGLGRRELIMDFTHYAVRRSDDGGIEIFGVTEQPVSWEFRVHIEQEDIPGLVHVALSKPVRRMFMPKIFTAIATIWRRRRFKVPEGLEERVKTAHSHVMERQRINRQMIASRANSGAAAARGAADDTADADAAADDTAADFDDSNDAATVSTSKATANGTKATGSAVGIG